MLYSSLAVQGSFLCRVICTTIKSLTDGAILDGTSLIGVLATAPTAVASIASLSDDTGASSTYSTVLKTINGTYTGTIENKKYEYSVYKTFSKQQKNQLRQLRLKSSGDTGSSSGSSSGQKRTISAITTPETAAAKKLRKKKQGAGVQFGSSGRNPSVVEDQEQ